jgi:hypothetical protein
MSDEGGDRSLQISYNIIIVNLSFQPASGFFSFEAAEVLDRMREGADRLRNNTNSFLSGELLGLVPVRISVSGETDESSMRIRPAPRNHAATAAAVNSTIATTIGSNEGKPNVARRLPAACQSLSTQLHYTLQRLVLPFPFLNPLSKIN